MSECIMREIEGNMEPCVTAVSITDPALSDVNDEDGDGLICLSDLAPWAASNYLNVAYKTPSLSSCGEFNKERAIEEVKLVRGKVSERINRMARQFGDCSKHVNRVMEEGVSILETQVIGELPIIERRGAASLGIVYHISTGKIVSIDKGMGAELAGIKVGDKILAIDGFRRVDSVEYKEIFLEEHPTMGRLMLFGVSLYYGLEFKRYFKEALFGKCGSMSTVLIERAGKLMTFEITRVLENSEI